MEDVKKLWLSDREVANRYGISRISVWRWAKFGQIPKPRKLTGGTTRWNVAELDQHDQKAGI